MTMKLMVNGEPFLSADEALSVAQLLVDQKVASPDMVSVQLNGQFVPKEMFSSVTLGEGDQVEFLYFMGGGQR